MGLVEFKWNLLLSSTKLIRLNPFQAVVGKSKIWFPRCTPLEAILNICVESMFANLSLLPLIIYLLEN